MKDAVSSMKPKRTYQRHGLTSVIKGGNVFDPKALDGRTTLAKELLQERNELIAALGGSDQVSRRFIPRCYTADGKKPVSERECRNGFPMTSVEPLCAIWSGQGSRVLWR